MAGRWIGVAARIIIGLVFIVAGVGKAIDLNFFYYQLKVFPFGLSDPAVLLLARVFTALEIVLGAALIINFWPRFVLPVAFTVLLVFLAVTIWSWLGGLSDECGCFGKLVKRSPAEAAGEDVILLFISFIAWRFARPGALTGGFKAALLGGAIVVGVGLPFLFPESKPKVYAKEGVGSYVGDLKPDSLKIDFARGDYFLALIETDCEHCQGAMPRLNALAQSQAVPKFVAVCPNTPAELESLKVKMPVNFPVGFIPIRKFLLMNPEVPALLWVKEGLVRHTWPIDSTPSVPEALRTLRSGGEIETAAKTPAK